MSLFKINLMEEIFGKTIKLFSFNSTVSFSLYYSHRSLYEYTFLHHIQPISNTIHITKEDVYNPR